MVSPPGQSTAEAVHPVWVRLGKFLLRPDEELGSIQIVRIGDLLRDFFIMLAVLWAGCTFVDRPLHEFGHFFAATLLGVQSHVQGNALIIMAGQDVAPWAMDLISVSGGLIAGVGLFLLFAVIGKPYRNGILPILAAELAYAPFDGTILGQGLGVIAFASVFSAIVAVHLSAILRAEGRTDPSESRERAARYRDCLTEYRNWLDGRVPIHSPQKALRPSAR